MPGVGFKEIKEKDRLLPPEPYPRKTFKQLVGVTLRVKTSRRCIVRGVGDGYDEICNG